MNIRLRELSEQVKKDFERNRTILSFSEYVNLLLEHPQRQLRSAAQYISDVFRHFGDHEVKSPQGKLRHFHLFDMPWRNGEERLIGHEAVQATLFNTFSHFVREGRTNRLVLLHGPNGSAKSTIVNCIMAAMEEYSRQETGARYTLNWVFPNEKLKRSDIGFSKDKKAGPGSDRDNTYAFLEPDRVDARIPCEMRDPPFFLIPPGERELLIRDLQNSGALPEDFGISDYVLRGDLCPKCRRIFDALLISYGGDFEKVVAHVQVVRQYLSKRYRSSIVTIEPQLSVDANLRQITADRSLSALPLSLQNMSLFEPIGALVDANRGVLEFSDLLKRPIEAFKYLLSLVETGQVTVDNFTVQLDTVFLASTNERYLDAFKEHVDFTSFKARMELVPVPYLLRHGDEINIYKTRLNEHTLGRHVTPHAIAAAAQWAILTRLRRPTRANYKAPVDKVIDGLTPMEKLKLYDEGTTPRRLISQDARELHSAIPDLFRETQDKTDYEGRTGASAREIATLLRNAANDDTHRCLTPIAVFNEISALIKQKTVYQFLRCKSDKGYQDHEKSLSEVESAYLDVLDSEVRTSMGLAEEKSYVDLFSRYVQNVSFWVKGERMRDPVTRELRDADEKFMEEVEKGILPPGECKKVFRNSIISTIGAHSLDHPDKLPDYRAIFPEYIELLEADFYTRRRRQVRRNQEYYLIFLTEGADSLDSKTKNQVKVMHDNLIGRFGYCPECSREAVGYLLRQRYGND